MDRQPVNSKMINSIGYDSSTGTLEIEFKTDGAVWQYFDFPEHICGMNFSMANRMANIGMQTLRTNIVKQE